MAIRLGLARMERALAALGHPERAFPSMHVAGTNGKGSTCAFAANALRVAGVRVGLYTSPHLERFNERIQVDGEPIGDGELAARIDDVRRACPWHEHGEDPLSYFEFTTLVALCHFAQQRVAAAVIEVGLGGRLDATNVIVPRVTAISKIGLDHMGLLGNTVDAVAREKAGIFKRGIPAVVAAGQQPEALAALRDEAAQRGAPFSVAPMTYPDPVALRGGHQIQNASLAAAALRLFDAADPRGIARSIREGIATVRWPGRLEELGGVLLDGAHNPDGAAALAAALGDLYPDRPAELIFGVLDDKDAEGMIAAVRSSVRAVYSVAPGSPRAMSAAACAKLARDAGVLVSEYSELSKALTAARHAAGTNGLVAVCGSLYLVGEARALLAAR